MASVAKPISNPSSASFLSSSSSSPAIFAVKSHRQISIPLKPIKLHLCTSSSSLRKLPNSRTSIWANHQDEQNTLVVLQEEDEDEEALRWENETPASGVSDWEADAGTGGEEKEEEEEEYSSPPPEDAKVFVKNLPYDIDSEKLAHLFLKAGVVEISEVIYNRETDQSRGFGFVTMSSVKEADKAVDMFNRYDLGGRLLTVSKATPRGSRPERIEQPSSGPSHTMYVGNLPWDMDNDRLEQVFSEHGKVIDARIVYDRESGRSRGFGFVSMSSKSEMNDAIQNLDGQSLGGRTIRVNVAAERRKHGAF